MDFHYGSDLINLLQSGILDASFYAAHVRATRDYPEVLLREPSRVANQPERLWQVIGRMVSGEHPPITLK